MPKKNKTLSDIHPAKHTTPDAPILLLFRRRHDDLWHSTRLLGGYEASRIVDECAARIKNLQGIDDRIWIMLNQVLSILSLEETDDPEKPFMGFFAVIDPNDPVVEEICQLTDELRTAMDLVQTLGQNDCERRFSFAA